jgi:hypothetical protein
MIHNIQGLDKATLLANLYNNALNSNTVGNATVETRLGNKPNFDNSNRFFSTQEMSRSGYFSGRELTRDGAKEMLKRNNNNINYIHNVLIEIDFSKDTINSALYDTTHSNSIITIKTVGDIIKVLKNLDLPSAYAP